jgi:hypothetical protein
MASLTGQLVAETYKALLKTIDNDILTASEKQITDGFGGGSNVFIDSQGFLRANKYKVTNGLATQFLKADGSLDSNTYLTGITSSQIISALGYTPVPTTRTLTINGTTYDLSANRSWTIDGTSAVWGNISGTLSNQTDLQNALNAKYNNPTGTISQYIRGDGTIANFPSIAGGLPTGGTAGQILAKIDTTDYNAHWIDNYATQTKNEVKLGQTLTKGTAVYVSSANGTNMIVSAASNATEATSSKTLGLLETGGATNDLVKCVTFGLLAGLDTSTATAGDPVWLGVNGALIFGLANKPYAPAHLVYIGVVTRVQSNNGEIFVNVQNGFELKEIHDVYIADPANNHGLFYDLADGLWKNKSIASALGYTPQAQLSGTGFVKASGTSISYDNSTYLTTTDAASTYQRLDKMVSNLLASDTEYPNSNAVLAKLALKADAANPVFTGDMTISGIAPKLYFTDTDNNPDYTLFVDSGYFYIYDQTAGATKFQITPSGNAINTGTLTSASFIKSGGTSSQYLMADGSVTTGPNLSGYVPYTGATANVDLGSRTLSTSYLYVGPVSSLASGAVIRTYNYSDPNWGFSNTQAAGVDSNQYHVRVHGSGGTYGTLRQFQVIDASQSNNVRFAVNFDGSGAVLSSGLGLGGNFPTADRQFVVSGTSFTSGTLQYQAVFNTTFVNAASNLYGIYVHNNTNANVTNSYSLFVATTGGSGTVTNKWGIYQTGSSDNNYFAGKVLVNTNTDAGYMLDVNGLTRVKTLFPSYAASTLANQNSGIIWTNGTIGNAFGFVIQNGLFFQGDANDSNRNFGIKSPTGDGTLGATVFNVSSTNGNTTIGGSLKIGKFAYTDFVYRTLYIGARQYDSNYSIINMNPYNGNYNYGFDVGVFDDGTSGNQYFWIGDNRNDSRFRIASSGNTLIGTTTDSGFKLDVNGTSRFSGTLRVDGASYPFISLVGGDVGYGGGFKFFGSTTQYAEMYGEYESPNNGQFYFRTRNAGSITTALRIQSTGAATFSSSVTAGSSITATTTLGGASLNITGSQSTFRIASNYTGGGDLLSGTLLYIDDVVNNNLTIIPSSAGTSGSKIVAAAYTPGAWRSMWEFANVGSGNPNLILVKSGGNVIVGTTTDNGYKFQVNGTATATNIFLTGSNYDYPNAVVMAGDTNWTYGIAHPGSEYWMQVKYYGTGDDSRGFRVLNVNGNTIDFRVNGGGSGFFRNSVTATAFYESSDIRLKTLIDGNAQIEGIENLQAKLYEKNGKMELGYFAQDAEKIMPYAVTKNSDGFLNLSYREVHTAKIARLEKEVAELKAKLNIA